MLRLGMAACVLGALAFAEGFTFTTGSPVAAGDFQAKAAAFVFRTEGCKEPANSQISGTAEGLLKGVRIPGEDEKDSGVNAKRVPG